MKRKRRGGKRISSDSADFQQSKVNSVIDRLIKLLFSFGNTFIWLFRISERI